MKSPPRSACRSQPWVLDPENKYLAHSFVESPEMLNVYSGTVTTDASGDAEVRLPDYFETLNSDYRYQLKVIGEFAQAIVARELQDNRFTIRTDRPRIKVCWQVTGVRQDPWAQANRIPVESNKDDTARGRYLHPELRGRADPGIRSRAIEARRRVIEMLPESLRERCEALLTSDRMDHDELQRLVDEATRIPAGPERTDPARGRLAQRAGDRAATIPWGRRISTVGPSDPLHPLLQRRGFDAAHADARDLGASVSSPATPLQGHCPPPTPYATVGVEAIDQRRTVVMPVRVAARSSA